MEVYPAKVMMGGGKAHLHVKCGIIVFSVQVTRNPFGLLVKTEKLLGLMIAVQIF